VHSEEEEEQKLASLLQELKDSVQRLRSLLEQGSIKEAQATIEELKQALERS
jgi:hypothetical protein